MIDYTQRLRYSDGRPVNSVITDAGYPGIGEAHLGRVCVAVVDGNFYDAEGRHLFNSYPAVSNVVVPLDTSGPLQTRDGKPAKYVGKMDSGQLVFAVTYRGYTGHEAIELRYPDGRKTNRPGVTSGDDIIPKVIEKVVYRNVYADGTVGTTEHAAEDDARMRSKYGKVRVGALKQTFHNGKLHTAVLQSSVIPWFRSSAFPKGREAKPEDFARG